MSWWHLLVSQPVQAPVGRLAKRQWGAYNSNRQSSFRAASTTHSIYCCLCTGLPVFLMVFTGSWPCTCPNSSPLTSLGVPRVCLYLIHYGWCKGKKNIRIGPGKSSHASIMPETAQSEYKYTKNKKSLNITQANLSLDCISHDINPTAKHFYSSSPLPIES